ncbi:MAG: hypothetical protein Kow00121_62300 [Elainellaceae cyanobacterium]
MPDRGQFYSIAAPSLFNIRPEQGVKFTNAYGDINEPFYYSMESMYQKAVETIDKSSLHAMFEERCRRIVAETAGMDGDFTML